MQIPSNGKLDEYVISIAAIPRENLPVHSLYYYELAVSSDSNLLLSTSQNARCEQKLSNHFSGTISSFSTPQ